MQIENERPAHHPGKIFPLTACFGSAAKGNLHYAQVLEVRQSSRGTYIVILRNNSAHDIETKVDTRILYNALCADYMAGRAGDLTAERLAGLEAQTSVEIPKPPAVESLFKAGTPVQGRGIYIYFQDFRGGEHEGNVFDFYAAPEDLHIQGASPPQRLLLPFNEAVDHVAALKGFHGHDGARFSSRIQIKAAARAGTDELGRWFIPDESTLDMLFHLRERQAFENSFLTKRQGFLLHRPLYHGSAFHSSYVVAFNSGNASHVYTGNAHIRLVRAERRPPGALNGEAREAYAATLG